MQKIKTYQISIGYFVALLFLIPIFYFVPISIKSGENLTQIASLSAYIRVFYDYLSLKNNTIYFNWETSNNLVSNANVYRHKKSSRMKFFNSEYTILSLISLMLFVISAFASTKKFFAIYSSVNIRTIHIIFLSILFLIGLYLCFIIHKSACMKNSLMDKTVFYVKKYIKRAYELEILSETECYEAYKELDANRYL